MSFALNLSLYLKGLCPTSSLVYIFAVRVLAVRFKLSQKWKKGKCC